MEKNQLDLSQVTQAQNEIKSAIEELKTTNAEKFKDLAQKGYVDSLVEQKVNNILTDIDSKFARIEQHINKPGNAANAAEAKDLETELKSFNLHIKSRGKNSVITVEEYKQYKDLFDAYLRKGDQAGIMTADEVKTMQIGHDPVGGYLVRPEWSSRIISKSFEYSPIRQLATVVNISTDRLIHIVDFDEFDASFIAEMATRSTTNNTTFMEKAISVHEIYAKPKVSQQLLEDAAIDVEGYVMNKVMEKMARKEANLFINGNGVDQPKGLLTYSNGSTYGTIEQVTTANSQAIGWNDVLDVISPLKDKYHANAKFLMRRQTFISGILKNIGGDGQYQVNVFEKGGVPVSILGYEVKFDADFPAIASNALAVAFGDFREAYTIADRIGVSVLRDPYSAKPAVEFYARKRTGGEVVNSEAVKILKVKA